MKVQKFSSIFVALLLIAILAVPAIAVAGNDDSGSFLSRLLGSVFGRHQSIDTSSGYPTGPLDMQMEAGLLLASLGEEKIKAGEYELKNRVYENAGLFPLTINDEELLAKNVKIKSSFRVRNGASEYRGSIDIALVTGEDILMQYEGTVTKEGLNTTAEIGIDVTSATGRFASLIGAHGHHVLKIEEHGNTLGSEAEIKIYDVSGKAESETDTPVASGEILSGSGTGYATGTMKIDLEDALFAVSKAGEVKDQAGRLEIKGTEYTAVGLLPVVVNGVTYDAELKVLSSIKTEQGAGEHRGTIEIDTEGGHITAEYRGAATIVRGKIISEGTYKTTKAAGIFAGLVAEGTYSMKIDDMEEQEAGTEVEIDITTDEPELVSQEIASEQEPASLTQTVSITESPSRNSGGSSEGSSSGSGSSEGSSSGSRGGSGSSGGSSGGSSSGSSGGSSSGSSGSGSGGSGSSQG